MTDLVFVSAGLTAPKKGHARVYRRHQYLNYGLLSLANSDAAEAGSVFHGGFEAAAACASRVSARLSDSAKTLILLSCPSFLALDWTARFLDDIRRELPHATIAMGGRWVVDGNVARLRAMLPQVSHFVEGLGEAQVASLVESLLGRPYPQAAKAKSVFEATGLSYLDYAKLDDPTQFVPSFEVSRGCGAGCAFCAEAHVGLTRMKPPTVLCEELLAYRAATNAAVDRYYLEASLFTPRADWIEELMVQREAYGLQGVGWRTEGRVDMFRPETIVRLAAAGLRVIDLGLESASHEQLRRMQKTKNPASYLRRCEELLESARGVGVLTKVNVLLFPGETRKTLAETEAWLDKHATLISGVSVYPTVYYGFESRNDPTFNYYRCLGASAASQSGHGGILMMNLSDEISAEDADNEARRISRKFMDARAYFALKSFSYFSPDYTYEEFLREASAEPDELGFRFT